MQSDLLEFGLSTPTGDVEHRVAVDRADRAGAVGRLRHLATVLDAHPEYQLVARTPGGAWSASPSGPRRG